MTKSCRSIPVFCVLSGALGLALPFADPNFVRHSHAAGSEGTVKWEVLLPWERGAQPDRNYDAEVCVGIAEDEWWKWGPGSSCCDSRPQSEGGAWGISWCERGCPWGGEAESGLGGGFKNESYHSYGAVPLSRRSSRGVKGGEAERSRVEASTYSSAIDCSRRLSKISTESEFFVGYHGEGCLRASQSRGWSRDQLLCVSTRSRCGERSTRGCTAGPRRDVLGVSSGHCAADGGIGSSSDCSGKFLLGRLVFQFQGAYAASRGGCRRSGLPG